MTLTNTKITLLQRVCWPTKHCLSLITLMLEPNNSQKLDLSPEPRIMILAHQNTIFKHATNAGMKYRSHLRRAPPTENRLKACLPHALVNDFNQ